MGKLWECDRRDGGALTLRSLDELEASVYETREVLQTVLDMPELSHRAFLALFLLQNSIDNTLLWHEKRKGN